MKCHNVHRSPHQRSDLPPHPLNSLRKTISSNQTESPFSDTPIQITFSRNRGSINQNQHLRRMQYVKERCMASCFTSRQKINDLRMSQSQTVFVPFKKHENRNHFSSLSKDKSKVSLIYQDLEELLQKFIGQQHNSIQIQEFIRIYYQKLALETKLDDIRNSLKFNTSN